MHFHLEGLPPYDGDFPIPTTPTNRELHTIKQMSGVRAGELEESMKAGDTDVLLALLVISLERSGHRVDKEQIWDSSFGEEAGTIQLILEPGDPGYQGEEAEKLPPQSALDASANGSEQSGSSGGSSKAAGGSQASDPSPIGSPDSDTGAPSDLETSAT